MTPMYFLNSLKLNTGSCQEVSVVLSYFVIKDITQRICSRLCHSKIWVMSADSLTTNNLSTFEVFQLSSYWPGCTQVWWLSDRKSPRCHFHLSLTYCYKTGKSFKNMDRSWAVPSVGTLTVRKVLNPYYTVSSGSSHSQSFQYFIKNTPCLSY